MGRQLVPLGHRPRLRLPDVEHLRKEGPGGVRPEVGEVPPRLGQEVPPVRVRRVVERDDRRGDRAAPAVVDLLLVRDVLVPGRDHEVPRYVAEDFTLVDRPSREDATGRRRVGRVDAPDRQAAVDPCAVGTEPVDEVRREGVVAGGRGGGRGEEEGQGGPAAGPARRELHVFAREASRRACVGGFGGTTVDPDVASVGSSPSSRRQAPRQTGAQL